MLYDFDDRECCFLIVCCIEHKILCKSTLPQQPKHDDHQKGITKTSKWFIFIALLWIQILWSFSLSVLSLFLCVGCVSCVCKINLPAPKTNVDICVDGMCNSDLFVWRAHIRKTTDHIHALTHLITKNIGRTTIQRTYEQKNQFHFYTPHIQNGQPKIQAINKTAVRSLVILFPFNQYFDNLFWIRICMHTQRLPILMLVAGNMYSLL